MAYFLKHKSVANMEPPADSFDYYGGINWRIDNVPVVVGVFSTRQIAVDAIGGEKNWSTADPAFTFTADNWKVVYICTDYDRRQWRYREERRFTREEYKPVPWTSMAGSWFDLAGCEEIARREQESDRYAHLSIKTPGKIAYTENDEHGYNDRQTATTPARYLRKFHSDITIHQQAIDAFIAAVTAGTQPPELKIARDADTIEDIYRNGPSSCMDGSHGFDVWPTRVYGDSDLGIAYIGDPANRVTARGIVWPDKQQYGRLYGDTYKLEIALHAAGYTEGSMIGARIRKIDHPRHSGAIVIPYVDNVDGAKDTGGGYLTLSDDGDISTSETCGYAFPSGSRGTTCQRCENWFDGDPDEDTYCPSCRRSMTICDGCSEDIWSSDDGVMANVGYYGYDYCENCYSNNAETCPSCEDEYIPEADHGPNRTAGRHTCRTCYDNGRHPCGDCGTYVDADDDYCEDCIGDHADDDDDQDDDTSGIDPVAVADALVTPVVRVIDTAAEDNIGPDLFYTLIVLYANNSAAPAICGLTTPDNPSAIVQGRSHLIGDVFRTQDMLASQYPFNRYVVVETNVEPPTYGFFRGEILSQIKAQIAGTR